MGGEGSISAMMSSLKNNKNLKGKRVNLFERLKGYRYKIKNKRKLTEPPHFTQEQMIAFKDKLKHKRKVNDIKKVLFFIISIILTIAIFHIDDIVASFLK